MNTPKRYGEAGIALLIVIMALLIVTAVAAGMMIYSTSEVKVDANYRDEQVALFAAKAGLEEMRDRVVASNPNTISGNLPAAVPTPGCTGCATYIISSTGIQPWLSGNSIYNTSTYDSEFMCELNACGTSFPTQTAILTNASYSGPASNPVPYQWVRVNLKPNETFDPSTGAAHWVDNSAGASATAQVDFDATSGHECIVANCPSGDNIGPVYEITSYAATPLGSVRMVQNDIAAVSFNLQMPSALTIPGPLGAFNPPNSNGYCMDGNDTAQMTSVPNCSFTPPPAVPGCGTTSPALPAVGVSPGDIWNSTTLSNTQYVTNQIPRPGNYVGSTGTTPSVGTPALPGTLSNPTTLEQELQMIQQNANVCLGCTGEGGGSYTYSDLTSAPGTLWTGSADPATTPQITYVNGNLNISGNTTGSGILVVTGNLTYDGNSSFNGIILVVGDGLTTYIQNGSGNGQFNGAIFVANTSGSPPGTYGPADFTINGGGGNGVYYNACWVNYVQKPVSYRILSSNEISQ